MLLDAVQRLAERLAGHEEVGAVHAGQLVQAPDAAQVGVQLLRLLQVPDHLAQHPHQVHLAPDMLPMVDAMVREGHSCLLLAELQYFNNLFEL